MERACMLRVAMNFVVDCEYFTFKRFSVTQYMIHLLSSLSTTHFVIFFFLEKYFLSFMLTGFISSECVESE